MESQTAGSSSVLETLNSLKEVISLFDYRRFLNAVHRTAWHLVKSNGQSTRHSNIDTTCEIFIEVLSQTDLAKQLVVMLGYEEISQSEGTLFMLDFNKHLSSLKSFCNVTEPQILVTVGDPAADKPPPDANNTFHIIAYISYHLYIRILLVLRCTEQPLLYTQEDKLVRSFQAVESAALKLGIMQPEFGVREVWDSCKRAALDFVTTPDANSGETLDKSLSDTIQMINEEVETKFSFHVHGVMSYLQNLQALARMTYDAAPIPSHAFPIFRRNEGRFSRSILSDEYRTSMDEVRSLMDTACQRGLTADEREQLYGRSETYR
ncbi:uncharacterized protein LOC134196803 [Corticium candelabrum]|uniref:uncharacterized protein LOC134196803 n=1 Tax=Corticium candelabrum TaxID=121492 RepID=UPI002E271F66|nr:uncharacterized protein LOC134196803 [Corticium candelabrum]